MSARTGAPRNGIYIDILKPGRPAVAPPPDRSYTNGAARSPAPAQKAPDVPPTLPRAEKCSVPPEPPRKAPDAQAQCAAGESMRADPVPRCAGVHVRVSGRCAEKLLAALDKRGIHPRAVHREGLRALSMKLNYADLQGFRAICVELKLDIISVKPIGITAALLRLKRRAALPVCAVLCVLLLGAVSTRVWRVEVDAPAALHVEVCRALSGLGVEPGAAKSALDLKSLETAISAAVPDVKFCQARVRGVTFTLTAQQAENAPETLTLLPAGGLYARCDAIIERVVVLSGHAAVARGDTVRAGDLLIAGEERSSREGTSPVKAMGIVTGRVWYEGRAEVPLNEITLERTGSTRTRRAIQLFGWEFILNGGSGWAVCDREITEQYIGGLFLPLRVETVRYFELTERARQRSIEDAKALAGDQALKNARAYCPENATVIDKWTEYSIIEENSIQARCVLEAEETIQCGG